MAYFSINIAFLPILIAQFTPKIYLNVIILNSLVRMYLRQSVSANYDVRKQNIHDKVGVISIHILLSHLYYSAKYPQCFTEVKLWK